MLLKNEHAKETTIEIINFHKQVLRLSITKTSIHASIIFHKKNYAFFNKHDSCNVKHPSQYLIHQIFVKLLNFY
jgi:hypothetical protein